jgi:LacI family transcriptional regulator, galactose operon repressor
MATILDIAQNLQVSPASVSRALNGKPGVNAARRTRILNEAARLNFVPHDAARSLATTETRTIGYALCQSAQANDQFYDFFYGQIMIGVEAELKQQGFHLLMTTLDDDQMARPEHWSVVRGRRVDGMILAGPFITPRFILAVYTQRVPLVLVDNAVSGAPIDAIVCDDQVAAYGCAEHLLSHGHRRIAILAGPQTWFTNRERCAGFVAALSNAGVAPLAVLHGASTTYEVGYRLMEQVLPARPEAILAVNDVMAMGAIDAARATGLAVPTQVAVTGFDDIAVAQQCAIPLTTVRQPKTTIGRVAARQLLQRIQEPDAPQQRIVVATSLVVRRSCGCHNRQSIR